MDVGHDHDLVGLGVGAQPTEQVAALLKLSGDWGIFKGEKGAKSTIKTKEAPVAFVVDEKKKPVLKPKAEKKAEAKAEAAAEEAAAEAPADETPAEARRAEREEMRRRARSDAMFSRLDADGNPTRSVTPVTSGGYLQVRDLIYGNEQARFLECDDADKCLSMSTTATGLKGTLEVLKEDYLGTGPSDTSTVLYQIVNGTSSSEDAAATLIGQFACGLLVIDSVEFIARFRCAI